MSSYLTTSRLVISNSAAHLIEDAREDFDGCWEGKEGGFFEKIGTRLYVGSATLSLKEVSSNELESSGARAFEVQTLQNTIPFNRVVSFQPGLNDLSISSYASVAEFRRGEFRSYGLEYIWSRQDCSYYDYLMKGELAPLKRANKFEGRWVGDQGSTLKIDVSQIVFRGDQLSYEVLSHTVDEKGEKFILKAIGQVKGYDSRIWFFVLRIVNSDEFYWKRYESEQALAQNAYTGIGKFYRQNKKQ